MDWKEKWESSESLYVSVKVCGLFPNPLLNVSKLCAMFLIALKAVGENEKKGLTSS